MRNLAACLFIATTLAGCLLDDPTMNDVDPDDKSLGGGKTPTEKDRYDAIASCMVNCVEKYDAGCSQMDTYGERQVCFDNCQYNQTYPDACESQYIALQNCRSFPLNSYDCNSAGAPVSTVSCLSESLALGVCKYQNQ